MSVTICFQNYSIDVQIESQTMSTSFTSLALKQDLLTTFELQLNSYTRIAVDMHKELFQSYSSTYSYQFGCFTPGDS